MLSINSLLLCLTAAATGISALPQSTPTSTIVQVCTGENYTRNCTVLDTPFDVCQQLSAPFLNNVGSFQPAPQTQCRITYTADTCTPHGDAFVFPAGEAALHTNFVDPATGVKEDVGAKLTSFYCQLCTAC